MTRREQAQAYALRCVAHRVRKFGFESILNRLDTNAKLILATMAHEPLASALRREAST